MFTFIKSYRTPVDVIVHLFRVTVNTGEVTLNKLASMSMSIRSNDSNLWHPCISNSTIFAGISVARIANTLNLWHRSAIVWKAFCVIFVILNAPNSIECSLEQWVAIEFIDISLILVNPVNSSSFKIDNRDIIDKELSVIPIESNVCVDINNFLIIIQFVKIAINDLSVIKSTEYSSNFLNSLRFAIWKSDKSVSTHTGRSASKFPSYKTFNCVNSLQNFLNPTSVIW